MRSLTFAATVALASLLRAPLAWAQEPRERPTSLNFVDAPIADVVRTLGRALGLTVVLTDIPEKRVTFATVTPVPLEELGVVLETILESNELVLVRRGAIAQVLPAAQAPATGEVRTGTDLPSPPPVGLVTMLVPLQGIRADEGAAAIRQVASPTARIEAVARSNALLVTDRAMHVARYLELLRRLDERPQGEAGLRTYVVPLRYADAEDLAANLGQVFDVAVVGNRTGSLADRGLANALDAFRRRDQETFRARQAVPLEPPPAASRGDTSAATQPGALVGRTTIVASPPTNSLIIRTAPPNFPLLRETIEALDTRPPQVLLEVTVAEVVLGRGAEFGVNWAAAGREGGARFGDPFTDDSTAGLQDFALRLVSLQDVDVRALLRAVATRTDVRVLSTPEILAANNREARILVGSRVPFISSTRLGNDVAIDRAVQYQDVGTTLTIIPTVNEDDYVSVQILQEVSNLTNQTIAAALNAPVISTREASTRAIIRNGQTVVIGGLIDNTREDIERGVPLLKDIPWLGNLFKARSVTRTRSEIAIFVTPHVVRTDAEADALRERARRRMNERAPGILPDTGSRRPPGDATRTQGAA